MNLEHEWANVARKVLACAINDKGAAVVSYEALAGKSFLLLPDHCCADTTRGRRWLSTAT